MGQVLAIDVDGIEDADLNPLLNLVDLTPTRQDVHIYKLSKQESELANAAEVKRLGIPYSDIKFVNFEDYSLRTNDKYDRIIEGGPDVVVFTKDFDLAVMLKNKVTAVFMY